MRGAFRFAAVAFTTFALVTGYYAIRLRWEPSADFDVIGILFVLQNLPRLTAVFLTGGFTVAAVYYWVRSFAE
jgi:hypothetical protein